MAVPGFQFFMLPLLKLTADGEPHAIADLRGSLTRQMAISEEDQRERVPSGQQTKLHNRISWAATYLKKAHLLEKVGRGKVCITDLGKQVLADPPELIDIAFLERFDGFSEFKNAQHDDVPSDSSVVMPPNTGGETPEELLEESYVALRKQLADDVLERVRQSSPRFFEELVVDLLVAMGYGGSRTDAGEAVGQSGDGGIDGIIKEDRLGLDAVYIQAKRWDGPVGRPVVQAFAGSLEGHRARKGVLITTSYFTADARDYVQRIEKKIILIDGARLAQYMIDYGVGVTEVRTYVLKRVDTDYFEEE